MQRPQLETVTLNDILITEDLSGRSPCSPNWQAEVQAMQTLARQMAKNSETMLQSLVKMAVELCQAGTAGVSLLETTTDGEEIFRWTVLAGTLAQYVGSTTPRNFSPCGVCLDLGSPQLYSHPERYFTYFQEANTPVVEGLVLPLIAENHALGTIWIMSHDEQRHFNPEDVRVMTSLADFTAAALLLNQQQTRELLVANAALEVEIVERKQAEEKLREAQRKLELSLSGASLGVWTYNVGRDEFWADERAKRMHGHEPHEVHTFGEAGANIHPEDRDRAQAAFAQAIQDYSKLQIEYRVIWRDGSVHWIASYAKFILTGNRDEGMFYGVAQDITDRKQAEKDRMRLLQEQAAREEERQRAESLVKLDHAKTTFFSNVSHEFRTPLTLLLAPLQDALSDRVNSLAPPQRERLELAHRNAIRLLKLVNTLLDFSRIEASRMEAVYEPTDLAMVTTELASVFRSAIERAGLRLIVDCPPMQSPVYVDREMWEKIVLNLLSNAFKFTLEGEIAVRLHPADDARVMLQIQDTGTGIPPEELPHLFERFYQVRGAKGRTYEGSGIGLALVHELIRLHGGTVDVSSTLGQGTCFTITIPLGTAHLPSERIQVARTLASTALGTASYDEGADEGDSPPPPAPTTPPAPPASPASPASPARILLVDDNADMRDYLTRILSEHVQVEAVADGAAALAAAQERVPDLVLSDVMMPGLDGFELLQALHADPRTREVPIILLSARAGVESVVEGLEAGADDYLIKPFSAQELVSRVNAHLQITQLRSEALSQERKISRRKDELLSIVSHELNTPLVAILGWTRLLRANPSSQSMLMKSLDTIERNATLQAKLIQDLLDISRITAGKVRLSLQPVELESVIETVIATFSETAEAKGIDLVWWGMTRRTSDAVQERVDPVVVMGDRDRLWQIVSNLLTNAVKFTPEGGQVEVKLEKVIDNSSLVIGNESEQQPITQQAQITITDTGIGIRADFLPHVFERFRQAEESGSSGGLGLGLAIARHLVELHNGTIHAESLGEGQGATFTIKLPILQDL